MYSKKSFITNRTYLRQKKTITVRIEDHFTPIHVHRRYILYRFLLISNQTIYMTLKGSIIVLSFHAQVAFFATEAAPYVIIGTEKTVTQGYLTTRKRQNN